MTFARRAAPAFAIAALLAAALAGAARAQISPGELSAPHARLEGNRN